jgi:hypothetical protein
LAKSSTGNNKDNSNNIDSHGCFKAELQSPPVNFDSNKVKRTLKLQGACKV